MCIYQKQFICLFNYSKGKRLYVISLFKVIHSDNKYLTLSSI